MTDMPHAASSRWIFLMAASGTPALAVGTFHVRMDIVKTRDAEEWPAHPDLWQGEPRLTLVEAEGQSPGQAVPLSTVPWSVPPDALFAQRLVPDDAAALRVTVTFLDSSGNLGIERPRLLVRTAYNPFFDFDDEGEPASKSDDGTTWTWQRAIAMNETDNPYGEASAWAFRVVAGAVDAPVPECEHGCYQAPLRYRIEAAVERGGAKLEA